MAVRAASASEEETEEETDAARQLGHRGRWQTRGGGVHWLRAGKPGLCWVSKGRTCSKNSGCRRKMRQLCENVGAPKGEMSPPASPEAPANLSAETPDED